MYAWDRLRPRRVAAAFTALGLSAAGLIGFAGVASALPTTSLVGVPSCDTTTGTWTVQWTGSPKDTPAGDIGTITVTSATPAGSLVVPDQLTTTQAPKSSYTFTQTGIAGGTTSVTVIVTEDWVANPAVTGKPAYALTKTPTTTVDLGTCDGPSPTPTPVVSVTTTCNSVTYTLGNTSVVTDGVERPAVSAPGTITYTIEKSTDGGTTYTAVDSVDVAPGDTVTKTESGAGKYQVAIGATVQAGSAATVTGVCSGPNPTPTPTPTVTPTLTTSGTIVSACPTVLGKNGSYVITITSAPSSTESAEFRVAETGTVVATSGSVAPGANYAYTGVLTSGEAVTITASQSVDNGVTWTPVTITDPAAVVCAKVLGVTFENPPPVTAPKAPTSTLPFTGMPVLPTLLVGFGLLGMGAALVAASRRRRSGVAEL